MKDKKRDKKRPANGFRWLVLSSISSSSGNNMTDKLFDAMDKLSKNHRSLNLEGRRKGESVEGGSECVYCGR